MVRLLLSLGGALISLGALTCLLGGDLDHGLSFLVVALLFAILLKEEER